MLILFLIILNVSCYFPGARERQPDTIIVPLLPLQYSATALNLHSLKRIFFASNWALSMHDLNVLIIGTKGLWSVIKMNVYKTTRYLEKISQATMWLIKEFLFNLCPFLFGLRESSSRVRVRFKL